MHVYESYGYYSVDLNLTEHMTFDEKVAEILSFADMVGVKITFDFDKSKSSKVFANLIPRHIADPSGETPSKGVPF